MQGYYDHGPTVVLERPIALVGYLTEETRVVGYRLAALYGLPSIDIDRRIEHEAGRSVWSLIWDRDEAHYRALERRQIERALRERPAGIVSLGDGALLDPASLALVKDQSHLVSFDLDLANTFWRLRSTENAARAYWHPLHPGPLERFEQVAPFWRARSPGFAAAHHRLDLPGRDKGHLVDALTEILDQVVAAQAG